MQLIVALARIAESAVPVTSADHRSLFQSPTKRRRILPRNAPENHAFAQRRTGHIGHAMKAASHLARRE